jgi:hypothetical protein
MLTRPDSAANPAPQNPYESAGTPDAPSKVDAIIQKDKDDLPF